MDINEYLKQFDKFTKDPTLEAMYFLLEKFDNPQNKVKIIHVAGTNGKGSVCEMLNRILVDSKYTVGKFISPQLIKFNETITVNDKEISDDEISKILEKLSIYIDEYNLNHEIKVKWFEVITSVALIYFAQKKCDFVILETGLGGTTDCTNVVNSMISIIVSVGLDHVDILGNNIVDIAKHKAGIIKNNSDVIYLRRENDKEVLDVIENKCKSTNSKLHLVTKEDCLDYKYDRNLQYFTYKNLKDIPVNLKGKKQIYNSTICLKAVEILREKGYKIENTIIINSLKNVIHRARFEKLLDNPEIIYDGAHNKPAIENLIETIDQYYLDKEKAFVVSILGTKDYKTIIKMLVQKYNNDEFYFTDGVSDRKFIDSSELMKVAKENNENGIYNSGELVKTIEKVTKKYRNSNKIIFIIGSFYIYKEVVDTIDKIKKIMWNIC